MIAALFVAGTLQKIIMPDAVQFFLSTRGWPEWLVWPALMMNTGGAICLIFGIWLAPTGIALALYCMFTSVFHFVPEDPWQMSIFVKNWAIAGGLLILSAHQIARTSSPPAR